MLVFSTMSRLPISVTIITLNEESNIARAVKSVAWADEVLVVDSGSTDHTVEIATSLGAKVVRNTWPGYGKQKNFAQKHAQHDWVLNIDADEEVSPELASEITDALARLTTGQLKTTAFAFPRKTFHLGRWIRYGGWYPNIRVRMADRRSSSWTEPSVHEDLQTSGPVGQLKAPLHHHSFPNIESQVLTNLSFSRLGSEVLRKRGQKPSVLKLLLKPCGKFVETYFLKLGFLDGVSGLIISVNAAHSMFLKYAYLFEPEILKRYKCES